MGGRKVQGTHTAIYVSQSAGMYGTAQAPPNDNISAGDHFGYYSGNPLFLGRERLSVQVAALEVQKRTDMLMERFWL